MTVPPPGAVSAVEPSAPRLPSLACDTHMHVYDARYPASPVAVLRPPDASADDYRAVQAQLGCSRTVVVQPTTYGLDNSCTLAAVAALGREARAVVVIDSATTDDELRRLTTAGARGARFHMLPGGSVPWSMLRAVAERIADFGWHIQLQLNGHELGDHVAVLESLPTPLVIDHVGRFMPPVAPTDERFRVLQRLVDTGRTWVKLSAPYESVADPDHRYTAVGQLVHALVQQAPERMLWASNWPHPGQPDPPRPDRLLQLAAEWLPDPQLRDLVLVTNPAALYGL